MQIKGENKQQLLTCGHIFIKLLESDHQMLMSDHLQEWMFNVAAAANRT